MGRCVWTCGALLTLLEQLLTAAPERKYIYIYSTPLRCFDGEAPPEHRFIEDSCPRVRLHGHIWFNTTWEWMVKLPDLFNARVQTRGLPGHVLYNPMVCGDGEVPIALRSDLFNIPVRGL